MEDFLIASPRPTMGTAPPVVTSDVSSSKAANMCADRYPSPLTRSRDERSRNVWRYHGLHSHDVSHDTTSVIGDVSGSKTRTAMRRRVLRHMAVCRGYAGADGPHEMLRYRRDYTTEARRQSARNASQVRTSESGGASLLSGQQSRT
jgi:hypothetical protein